MVCGQDRGVFHISTLQIYTQYDLKLTFQADAVVMQARPKDYTESDLTLQLSSSMHDRSGVYSKALVLLVQMQTAPSCRRLAATDLITDCRSIEGATSTSASDLDDVKEIYAARLALCELQRADAQIPSQCEVISKISKDSGAKTNGDVTNHVLRLCLKNLESRPQWWTSYSNALQETEVMCQAARIEIEKGEKYFSMSRSRCLNPFTDDLIELHKKMVRTGSGIDATLTHALAEANDRLLQQRNFVAAVKSIQKDLLQDIENSRTESRSFFYQLMGKFESNLGSVIRRMTSGIQVVEKDIANLDKVST